jgi:GNAT superfamily N-acetyltransferase
MAKMIDSLSHPDLTKAIEAINVLTRIYGEHILAARFYDTDAVTWCVTDSAIPGFNIVVDAKITPENLEDKIDEILQTLAASGLSITWIVGPSMRNTGLKDHLQSHGWTKVGESPTLVLDVQQKETHMESPAGLTIERVDTYTKLEQYVRTLTAGYGFPASLVRYLHNLRLDEDLLEDPRIHYYLGWFNGEPVATAALLQGDDIVGINSVSTLSQMRHRGIGTAMLQTIVMEARRLGYRIITLQSTPMGMEFYYQFGFQDYCTFEVYTSSIATEK